MKEQKQLHTFHVRCALYTNMQGKVKEMGRERGGEDERKTRKVCIKTHIGIQCNYKYIITDHNY